MFRIASMVRAPAAALAAAAWAVTVPAASSLGQGTTTDQVRLELRLVSQIGTPSNPASAVTSADLDVHVDASSHPGVPRRFEVQYRIVDLNAGDAIVPAGLTAGTLRITATGGTLERAVLSRFEARNPSAGTPPLPPVSQSVNLATDTSIISGAAGSPWTGMHQPFRGAFSSASNNNLSPNGTLQTGNTVIAGILPFVNSQTDQNDGGWYGLYSFNLLPTSMQASVSIAIDVESDGNRFGFFNSGVFPPVASPNATSDAAIVIVGPCAGLLPVITQQPLSQSVLSGETATFTVAVSPPPVGSTFTYRWRRDGGNLLDQPTGTGSVVAGATTPTLSIINAGPLDSGRAFDCVITAPCGSVRTDPAGLNVTWRCQADFNRSGIISVQDIFDFLAAFFAGCP